MNLAFFVKTCTNIRSGHPFLKPTSIKSRGSEGVFKKCGKQEEGGTPREFPPMLYFCLPIKNYNMGKITEIKLVGQ